MAGAAPKGTMRKLLGASVAAGPPLAVSVAGSAMSGGWRYRTIGKPIAASTPPAHVPSSQLRNERRPGRPSLAAAEFPSVAGVMSLRPGF